MQGTHPGIVNIKLCYSLKVDSLSIKYHAYSNESTAINLTNHSYFNLNPSLDLSEQHLYINANRRLGLDSHLLPTGDYLSVGSTPYDFNQTHKINGIELDDCYILSKGDIAARLIEDANRLQMEVLTDQSALVVYLNREVQGICFESQGFPNAPNHPHFPSSILHPGETYQQHTQWRFSSF